ncbi:MAG: hypothetical protein OEW08_03960 [Gammaproteobacteria bacterium]|nr:hypothetical protein [Gammaproteobacteria bacterium]
MAAPRISPHITRLAICELLGQWRRHEINEVMVLEWADIHVNLPDARYLDEESDGSIAHEVLLLLSCLDLHLVTADDVPCYLALLATPPGEFRQGWQQFAACVGAIDLAARRHALAGHPLYQISQEDQAP